MPVPRASASDSCNHGQYLQHQVLSHPTLNLRYRPLPLRTVRSLGTNSSVRVVVIDAVHTSWVPSTPRAIRALVRD